jgi:hypothetical protein
MVRGVGWLADWVSNTSTVMSFAVSKSGGAAHGRRGSDRQFIANYGDLLKKWTKKMARSSWATG